MAVLFQKLQEGYQFLLFEEIADPRAKHYSFTSSPLPVLALMASYLYFCKVLGPRLMKDIKPFNLKYIIVIYNALQTLLSFYIAYLGSNAYINNYNYFCQPVVWSYHPKDLSVVSATAWYYFAKITELLDTVFFVLRKKDSHVTVLHLYHHASMPFLGWMTLRYFAGGQVILVGLLNSIVHVFMYFYYMLSALGPGFKKYLWWKKYITTIQLVQFTILLCHNSFVIFTDCTFPKGLHVVICMDSILFLYMFGKFYISNYIKESRRKLANKHEKLMANGKEIAINGKGLLKHNGEMLSNGKEKLFSNGKEDLLSNGKEGVLSNGKEHLLLNSKEDLLSNGKEELLLNGKEDLLSNGKEDLLLNSKEDLLSNGKEELLLNSKEDLLSNGKEELLLNGKEDLLSNGKEDLILNSKEYLLSNGKEDLLLNGKENLLSNGKGKLLSNGKLELHYKGETLANGKDKIVINGKNTRISNGKESTIFNGKEIDIFNGIGR